jgi:hypothetical protein
MGPKISQGSLDVIFDLLDFLTFLNVESLGLSGDFHHWYMDRKTRNWPVTPITIAKKSLKDQSRFALSYTYSVGKEVYGGYQELSYDLPADATRFYDDPVPLFARYDPKRPDRSWIP